MSLTYSNADDEFTIRIPLNMLQFTHRDGKTRPVAFDWPNVDGINQRVNIDRVISVCPFAEQKRGAVGDRNECEIEGKIEYIFYAKLMPQKWFKIVSASEQEYNAYYRLPGEG